MIDDKDRKILNELIQDCRQSFGDVGKKVGLSTVTVIKRVKRLEREKVLSAYSAVLDYEKLGYDVGVLINLKIAYGKYVSVYDKLKKNPSISAIYNITGAFDAMIVAKFKNRRMLDGFLKRLQSVEHIERTNTVVILSEFEKKGIQIS